MICPICDSDNVREEFHKNLYHYICKDCNYEWD